MLDNADRITGNAYMIGNSMVPVYLITGPKLCILIDAGMTIMGPVYIGAVQSCLENNNVPLNVLLTHSHYDHLGSIAYLKKRIPQLKVGGYYTIDSVLQSRKAVDLITSLNRDGENMMGVDDPEITFKPFQLDTPLKGGETFDTGDDVLEAIYTPGHTKDSMCYYLRNARIMFTGEEAGIKLPSGGILPEFLTSCKSYISSLDKLGQYTIDYVAVGHGNVIKGEEARQYIADSLQATHAFVERIREYYRESGSIDAVVERIKEEDYIKTGTTQPERAYRINLQAKVKAVVEDK